MWLYDKKLQYPVKIKNPNPKYAQIIISQLGGPDGELAASTRYLSQRYSMPYDEVVGILTDIGTEELAHVEMICAIISQLTRNLSMEEIKRTGFDTYFVDHTAGVYPVSAAGVPFDAKYIGVKGDVIADITEDLAAEQKARVTYDNILRLVDDPDICDPIKFLRQRELTHFQRFGDALSIAQRNMNSKNFYGYNPAFDNKQNPTPRNTNMR
ncbi:MAG: manganese catalase family protein [Clostridia bacterium]|nr:manganese catalase family protein [Clostridia bacterium]